MDVIEADQEFEALLDYLKNSRGCDLTGYKRSTLMRRFTHRMQELKIEGYLNYLHYLQSHPEECSELLNTVLINVTTFFRDPDAWITLAKEIIPQIIAGKQADEPIRVWSAGCASGQEVYSLIILFAEALGIQSCLKRVKFYATDVDEAELEQAREALYQPKDVTEIPANLLEKYFHQTGKGYLFHPQLCRNIIFGRHNLLEDAPISKIDLLACRNVLIYFNTGAQATILARFHFALRNNGFLFLGKAETLVTNRHIFTVVNPKHRLYAKGQRLGLQEHFQINPKRLKKPAVDSKTTYIHIWQTAFETSSFAQLAVDSNSCLIITNEQANALFGLTLNDWGRPLLSLKIGQIFGLCRSIYLVSRKHRSATLESVEGETSSGIIYFDIFLTPVFSLKGNFLSTNLTFIEVIVNKDMEKRLEHEKLKLAKVTSLLEETQAALDITQAALESSQKELEVLHQEIQLIDLSASRLEEEMDQS